MPPSPPYANTQCRAAALPHCRVKKSVEPKRLHGSF